MPHHGLSSAAPCVAPWRLRLGRSLALACALVLGLSAPASVLADPGAPAASAPVAAEGEAAPAASAVQGASSAPDAPGHATSSAPGAPSDSDVRAEAAARAKATALRVESAELARLEAVQQQLQAFKAGLAGQRKALAERRVLVLALQGRIHEARQAGDAQRADEVYDQLRQRLRTSREDLDGVLDALQRDRLDLPAPGPDTLGELQSDTIRQRRAALEQAVEAVRVQELALRREEAAAYHAEIVTLNKERLGLLPALSRAKRQALTGLSLPGWDQALAEVKHLRLILRYHQYIATEWVKANLAGGYSGSDVFNVSVALGQWSVLVFLFAWWHRRSTGALTFIAQKLMEFDRSQHLTTVSLPSRMVRALIGPHRPLEWLLFFWATMWLLPAEARDQLEIQLLTSVVSWTLGGAFVVEVINAIAAGRAVNRFRAATQGALRLRSLRLIGRVVVVLALVLSLSAQLVGEGTIYRWVISSCWFIGVLVYLVLVRWWRGTVFARVERLRKKTPLQSWVLANRHGWRSFLAAMVGAAHLFSRGLLKGGSRWLSDFNLTRRAHAYLFRREINRIANEKARPQLHPLSEEALAELSPDLPCPGWIACPAEEQVKALSRRVSRRQGGVVALVGGRGMGKTSMLRHLVDCHEGAHYLSAQDRPTLDAIRERSQGGAADTAGPRAPAPLLVIDDMHALVKPMIGGLQHFDAIMDFARQHASHTTWVIAVNSALWPYLRRARDERPLFDDVLMLAPWNETQLGHLLAQRNGRAELTPGFDNLLEDLPTMADESDRQDALMATQTGYIRMLWDHVRGNPGVALEVWRSSLETDDHGHVLVRPLQVPDAAILEDLPDPTLFVLRAVLQLGLASPQDLASVTRQPLAQVLSTLRFCELQGFLEGRDGQVQVTWRWLRAVSSLLERRHLLINP